ncbi:GT2 family glycosyltransferase [Prauserella shujinwangii]|uniref:GT2 family glycosyltransferase n=1 Tax=Prauserella shujinwangii TaxID=1453103 RepID=A0A2T0LX85_9PSEU|nr:glycosyltransferase [Prauserella shujinwangii]PRX48607.1 GT2 family glycosyltransferase [Prauserella shujinwangii]
MSRVTVVMITHNRREEALRTLGHMTALPDGAPVVVADNASADGTADAVAERFPGVRLLRCERNLGALARNVAVRQVTTPYVSFCDDDTRWQPGALTRAADLLDAHPGLGSVTGRCLVEPGLEEDPITPELRHSPVRGPDWLPGPALLGVMAGLSTFRVSAFREVGGFSPRMWLGGEEELLALDLAARGWWMCWAEDVVIHHAPSRQRDPRRRRQLGIRNTLWTLWLRRPWRSVARRTADVLRSAPADRATAAAVAEALRGLPWVLRERRVVPASVEAGLRSLEESQRRSAARRYVG